MGSPTLSRVELDYAGGERLTMNMGPQHPSAHGVFRAILTLEGETVVGVDAVIGYLHRCHEKLAETLTYAQYPSIASKTDYVAAMTSEFAYVMAAEEIGKIDVPRRAQYLRVIAAELQRVASHLLWLGTWCMDMGGALGGGATIFLYCHSRAGADPRPVRITRRRATALRLLSGRGRPLRHPGGMGRLLPPDYHPHRSAHRRVPKGCSSRTRSSWPAPRAWDSSRGSWPRTSASRGRCCEGRE